MSSSKYADEGTCAHALAAMCLNEGKDAAAYIGRLIECHDYEHARLSASGSKKWITCPGSHALEAEIEGEFVERSFSMEVTEEMAAGVQIYLGGIEARVAEYWLAGAKSVETRVEQSLSLEHITGEGEWRSPEGIVYERKPDEAEPIGYEWKPATGTGDAVIIVTWPDDTVLVELIDLKFGMGVEVEAEANPQLMMYASGVLQELALSHDVRTFRLTISQPRIKTEFSEWTIGVDVLNAFEIEASEAAKTALTAKAHLSNWINDPDATYLQAGDHCRTSFCKARATCPKLARFVQDAVGADFESIVEGAGDAETAESMRHEMSPANHSNDVLSVKMKATEIIEDWCKAVRALVDKKMLDGEKVPGFKLVQGKKGNREFDDEDAVEEELKAARLKKDITHVSKLKTPTQLEKVLKDEKPKVWKKIAAHITQSDGKPSVAPESDKRPALDVKPVSDDFEAADENSGDDLAG